MEKEARKEVLPDGTIRFYIEQEERKDIEPQIFTIVREEKEIAPQILTVKTE